MTDPEDRAMVLGELSDCGPITMDALQARLPFDRLTLNALLTDLRWDRKVAVIHATVKNKKVIQYVSKDP